MVKVDRVFKCLAGPVLLLTLFATSAQPVSAAQSPVAASSADSHEGQKSNSAVPQPAGSVNGQILDATGVAVVGAAIKMTGTDPSTGQPITADTVTDADGRFVFSSANRGPFHLTISAAGFATNEFTGNVQSGENFVVPTITLAVASVLTEVRVVPPQVIAEAQVKEEETQKALGFIPNFYVSYVPNAVPLAPRQKFELAWKTMIDPVSFGISAVVAGIQQGQNDFSGYGLGADGYAKRFGAAYADDAIGTFLGSAIFPSLFKQDPRYFYKGTGSKRSRVLYAVANSVICKGDNGRWQANYSAILGAMSAGAISNLYYPSTDRNAAKLTFENALIGIGATAAANILQEFVIRKLTPNLTSHDPASGSGGKVHSLVGRAFSTFGSSMRDGD